MLKRLSLTILLCIAGILAQAAALLATMTNPIDGAEMVRVPSGKFTMGTTEEALTGYLKDNPGYTRESFIDEMPPHEVELDAYYIYKNEVTVGQYRKFLASNNGRLPDEPAWKWQDNQPIVNVSWDDAKAYANWAGATLPTEAQWEMAARGTDGRIYPWGNTWDASKARCSTKIFSDAWQPSAVGSYPGGASPYGCLDMAGNVWEWCDDFYSPDFYLKSPTKFPAGPATGATHILRGGSWGDYNPNYFRSTFRPSRTASTKSNDCGFRCVLLPPRKINPMDGATMLWMPGTTFTMGSAADVGFYNERPAHQVTLSGYWIYKYDVTVAQYRSFCADTKRLMPTFPGDYSSWRDKTGWNDPALQQHPIVNVSWEDANAYAEWAGVALPTEAQWEYAAHGPQGRNYPWGGVATKDDPNNGWDATKCANNANSRLVWISTWRVGSFFAGASWCGAQDMSGNVFQWCSDWYGPYTAGAVTDPTGPETGKGRVKRGGSWYSVPEDLRASSRYSSSPTDRGDNYGFRCVSRSPGVK
ncbi:MAG: SUMF1/EgtB/PvdO family nonheme iron enzyme [bacterium]